MRKTFDINMDDVAEALDYFEDAVATKKKRVDQLAEISSQWKDVIYLSDQYGPFKPGRPYRLIECDNDYVVIRHKGSNIYIPVSFTSLNPRR